METPTSKPIRLVTTVRVINYHPDGEPWPVVTVHTDAAGQVMLTGDASKGYAPLLTAAKKAASRLANQSIKEALQEARTLKEEMITAPAAIDLPPSGEVF